MTGRLPLRRVRRRLASDGGYTLSEMLVVLVVLGIVVAGITQLFSSASKAEIDLNRRFQAQQNARLALDTLRREIHNAYLVDTTGFPSRLRTYQGSGSTTPITWCATGSSLRYKLWRIPGALTSCATSTAGAVQKADYLTTDAIFGPYSACGGADRLRAKVAISLPVDLTTATTQGRYTLQDDIVLRNTSRTC